MTDQTPSPPKSSTGLDQNLAAALAYLLWPVSSIILLLIEKENKYVRFHAMQATLVCGALIVLYVLLAVVIVGLALYPVILIAQVILWVFMMYKAFSGEQYKLPWFGDFAEKQLQKM